MERYARTLVMSDTQAPFHHKDSITFFKRVAKEYGCKEFVHIGDEIDWRYLSKFGRDPNDPDSPNEEFRKAKEFLKELYAAFREVSVCTSNHGLRFQQRAREAYLPEFMLKSVKELLESPRTWKWRESIVKYNGSVEFEHGVRAGGGVDGALRLAIKEGRSVCIGHHSSRGGVLYHATKNHTKWGMCVGGMIDEESYGMAWAKHFVDRITLGCGVILDDGKKAIFEPFIK